MTQSGYKRHYPIANRSSLEELSTIASDIRAPINQIEEQSELLLQELDPADRKLAVQAIRSAVGTLRLVLNDLEATPQRPDFETTASGTNQLSTHAVLRLLAARLAFAAEQHEVDFELEADIDLPLLSESDAELTKRALMRVIEYLIRVVGAGGSIHLHCRQPETSQALALDIKLNPQGDVAALCMGVGSISDLRALIDDEGCFDDAAACLGGAWRVEHDADSSLVLHLDCGTQSQQADSSTPTTLNAEAAAPAVITMEESLVQVEPIAHRFDLGREQHSDEAVEIKQEEASALSEASQAQSQLEAADQVMLAPTADGILGASIEKIDDLPRILIVDDNTISQRLLLRMLDAEQYHSVVESDARNVLTILASESFSTILIDCRIVGFDCYRLASEIRNLEKQLGRTAARIVGMSSNLERDSAERCREAGMDSFISKPISRTALAQVIAGRTK